MAPEVIKTYNKLTLTLASELGEDLDLYKLPPNPSDRFGYRADIVKPTIASLVGKLERQFEFNPPSQQISPINVNVSANAENNNIINVNQTLQSVMSLAQSPEDKKIIEELMS